MIATPTPTTPSILPATALGQLWSRYELTRPWSSWLRNGPWPPTEFAACALDHWTTTNLQPPDQLQDDDTIIMANRAHALGYGFAEALVRHHILPLVLAVPAALLTVISTALFHLSPATSVFFIVIVGAITGVLGLHLKGLRSSRLATYLHALAVEYDTLLHGGWTGPQVVLPRRLSRLPSTSSSA